MMRDDRAKNSDVERGFGVCEAVESILCEVVRLRLTAASNRKPGGRGKHYGKLKLRAGRE